jgi:hypothetical protein
VITYTLTQLFADPARPHDVGLERAATQQLSAQPLLPLEGTDGASDIYNGDNHDTQEQSATSKPSTPHSPKHKSPNSSDTTAGYGTALPNEWGDPEGNLIREPNKRLAWSEADQAVELQPTVHGN